MRIALLTSASLLCLALASPTLAESAGAPATTDAATEVTVIATRSEKKVDDVPATVSVITAHDMEDRMVTDIKDLVRYEPGVSVRSSPSRFTAAGSNTGRDGNSGFNIRGLEGNRVLIQIDGVRVPDGFAFGGQSVGRGDYVGLDLLKSVEILRGPASALYGSDGVAGAVSYTTKNPSDYLNPDQHFGGQAKLGYSSADDSWSKGLVFAARNDNGWSGMLAYTRRDGHEQETHGKNDAPNITRTKANPQDIDSNAVLGKIVYQPSEAHRFRLTLDHLDAVVDTNALSAVAVPPLASTSVLALTAHDTTDRDRVSFDYRYVGTGFIDSAFVVVYGQTSKSSQNAFEDRNTAADRIRINDFDNKVFGGTVELTSRFDTGSVTHNLVYGGDYSKTRQESLRDGTVPPAGEVFPTRAFPNTDYERGGLFIQDEITLADGRLSLYPALRYDSYKLTPKPDALLTSAASGQDGNHVSPKLSALWRLTPDLSVFLNYAEGFKAPSPNEVNNAFANPIANYKSIPNPNLKPETSRSLEGGVRFGGRTWNAGVTAFTSQYKNFIDQIMIGGAFTPANPAIYQYVNYSRAEISGVEAKAAVRLSQTVSFTAAGSLTTGTQTTLGVARSLASIDPAKVVAGLTYRAATGNYGGALSVTHAEKKAAARAGITCTPSCYIPDAFTTLDVTAFWNVTDRATLRAGVFNLTDEKYAWWSDARGLSSTSTVIDAYTQPGINGSVSLSYRF